MAYDAQGNWVDETKKIAAPTGTGGNIADWNQTQGPDSLSNQAPPPGSELNASAAGTAAPATAAPIPYGNDGQAQTETQAQPPGITASSNTQISDAYQKAFGTAATPEQMAWFNTQDPAAIIAHINAQGAATAGTPTYQAPAPTPPAGAGGWVPETLNGMSGYKNPATGQWVPGDHPLATSAGNPSVNPNGGAPTPGAAAPAPGAAGTGGAYTPPNSAPGTPGATPIDTQAANAKTYSQTPGAAPLQNTTNQGTQDVVRNTLIDRLTQGTAVDPNDPNIRQQSDAFRAQAVRAARETQADQAVAGGPNANQFVRGQQRAAGERAGQAAGQFEAQLVGNELQQKRSEIKDALTQLGDTISGDQKLALQKQLAELEASIQKHGIDTGAATAASEIALKDKLGTGGLNVDLMRALLQNRQFGDELGFNIADREAMYNNQALQNLL